MRLLKKKNKGKDLKDIANDVISFMGVSHMERETLLQYCRETGISVHPYSSPETQDLAEKYGFRYLLNITSGIAFRNGNDYLIFFDDNLSTIDQEIALAHELGHIILGDLSVFGRSFAKKQPLSELKEVCADAFALYLLFPDTYTSKETEVKTNEP